MVEKESLKQFREYLKQEEKSEATCEKYLRDVRRFLSHLQNREISKETTMAYKAYLTEHYASASVNSMLVALNVYLRFLGLEHSCVKLLKIQRQLFAAEEKEMSRHEYQRLVKAAGHTRISYVIQTICATGIRVSELQYITVEAVQAGKAVVNCKNKTRVIFIPSQLRKLLNRYIKNAGLQSGAVFVSRNGKPLSRGNIWRDMKALCGKACVTAKKIFPHNLRHLFARMFYSIEKDIVRLADLLGHSNINTTRIYTIETGSQNIDRLNRVEMLLRT